MLEMSVVPNFTIDQCNLRAMPFELTFYQEILSETCYIKELSHILFSCMHVNTIVYLEVIENPVEYQNLL